MSGRRPPNLHCALVPDMKGAASSVAPASGAVVTVPPWGHSGPAIKLESTAIVPHSAVSVANSGPAIKLESSAIVPHSAVSVAKRQKREYRCDDCNKECKRAAWYTWKGNCAATAVPSIECTCVCSCDAKDTGSGLKALR